MGAVGAKTRGSARRGCGLRCVAQAALAACILESEAKSSDASAPDPGPAAVELSLAYKAEGWAVSGGRDAGTTYIDNLDVGLTAELEAIGWTGATFSASALYNNRNQLGDLVGDFQGVSNIDADGSPRLYQLWLEQRLARGWRAKLGIIDLNSEFDVNGTGSLFINSSHGIAPDFSQVGANGPSIFPAPGLGALAEASGRSWAVRLGLFEGVPRNPEHPRRTVFGLTSGEGALLVLEGEYSWTGGRAVVGLRHHSGDFVRWAEAGASPPSEREDSAGAYLLVDEELARWGARELRGFARMGIADRRIHEVELYTGAGLVLQGPLLGLDGEQLGVAVASAWSGAPYRHTLVDDDGARRETSLELTYSGLILPWLTVQPDVQWVINPGFSRRTEDALAFGLRFTAAFSWGLARAGSADAPSGASPGR
jgi:porin